MIASNDNAKVKNVRELNSKHKARVTQSLFVVEGVKLVYIGGEEPCSWFPLNFAHVPFPFVDIVLIFFFATRNHSYG